MNWPSQVVTFDLTCPEPRAWLVLTSEHSKPRVVEMQQQAPSKWSIHADLPPGEYLCRYYGGDEDRVMYYGAAHTEGSIECGMDALISITRPRETKERQFVQ